MPSIFEVTTAKDLFDLVEARFKSYCNSQMKSTEDIMCIIMFVNHLCEWIAPGYQPKDGKWALADTPAKKLSKSVYDNPSFSIVRELCNGTKHAKLSISATVKYEPNMLAWENLLAVKNIFRGAPTGHLVDGKPIETHIELIMKMYREWFTENAP